jgi:uncharacterized protein
MSKDAKKLLSTKQVAEMFGVNPMTIYRKVRMGELPAIKFGKNWLFPEDALNSWIKDNIGKNKLNIKKPKEKPAVSGTNLLGELPPLILVYQFGSRVLGLETPVSDLDIAYLDDGSVKPFDFEIEIEDAVRKIFQGMPRIDLVRLNDAPIVLKYKILKTGRLLYARADAARADFEADTVMKYLDYEPTILNLYGEAA